MTGELKKMLELQFSTKNSHVDFNHERFITFEALLQTETSCPPGYFGDPSSGLECQGCPCPLTTPSNQFARECYLDVDRQVTCRCPPGYTGRRCGECDTGYVGNPTILGNSCTRGE